MTTYNELRLDNQLCFPLYAASRMITRMYQPLLKKLGLTYPQYLILMVLWEENEQSVTGIGAKLRLSTNTLTPLLKRMETQGIVVRKRSPADERIVKVMLTPEGEKLKEKAVTIPRELGSRMLGILEEEELLSVMKVLKKFLGAVNNGKGFSQEEY